MTQSLFFKPSDTLGAISLQSVGMPRSKSSLRPDSCSIRNDQVGSVRMISKPGISGCIRYFADMLSIFEVESMILTVVALPEGTCFVNVEAMTSFDEPKLDVWYQSYEVMKLVTQDTITTLRAGFGVLHHITVQRDFGPRITRFGVRHGALEDIVTRSEGGDVNVIGNCEGTICFDKTGVSS